MSVTVEVTRTVHAPRARVWSALTTTELADWFWPPAFETRVAIDLVPGGVFDVVSEPAGMAVEAMIASVDPTGELALDWTWRGEPDVTEVTIQLVDRGESTILGVTHAGNADQQAADNHRAGWESCLNRLPAYLDR